MSDKEVVNTLNLPISKRNLKTIWICALVILASILMHDGDHLRQAFNWGYSKHSVCITGSESGGISASRGVHFSNKNGKNECAFSNGSCRDCDISGISYYPSMWSFFRFVGSMELFIF